MADDLPAFRKKGTTEAAVFHLEMVPGVPGRYKLKEPFEYVKPAWVAGPQDFRKVVPSPGQTLVTDLASIPFFATWLVPRDGKHTPAALLHDWLYAEAREAASHRERVGKLKRADWIFRGAMDAVGVALVRRWLMWAAVSAATFVKGSIWRVIRHGLLVFSTGLLSFVCALMAFDSVFEGSLEWVPRGAERVLTQCHAEWVCGATAYLESFDRVPHVAWWQVGALALGSSILWGRSAGVAALTAAAIMLFGFPLLLAALSFGIYWAIEVAAVGLQKLAGCDHVHDVSILTAKDELPLDAGP